MNNLGIQFLYDEYKKNPERIEKLLEEKLTISEKLDGSRFQVESDQGNRLIFFKRRETPITKIDRTVARYYEKAIYHFENLPEEKTSKFPEGWRFGMEYFPSLHPVVISYDRMPLNNLVLTDIQVRDPKERLLEVITDKETLQRWSEILEVEGPPVIFEGELSPVQRRKILDFLNTPYQSLVGRFRTENFTAFILGVLNPEMKSSFMHNDMAKDIDGLIFRFAGKEALRVSNPDIQERRKKPEEKRPSDIYNLTLVIIQEFVTSLDLNKIKLRETSFEDRYIEFICKVFNLFVQSTLYRVNFSSGVDFDLPKFLTREESTLNFRFVKDPETLRLLEESTTNRELFKIFLASLRSHKKRPAGFFTKEMVFHHNELVDKIADYINSMQESSMVAFSEFKRLFLNEYASWQEEFGKEVIECEEPVQAAVLNEEFPAFDHVRKSQILDHVSGPLGVLRKAMIDEDEDLQERTPVCLLKGKFHPFHKGHLAIIEDARKATGMDVFLAVTCKNLPEKHFSRELHEEMMKLVTENNPGIKGFIFTDGRSLREISRKVPDGIRIAAYAGSPSECEDAAVQMGEGFQTHNMTKHLSSRSVLEKVKEEDLNGFRNLMPKYLHNHFYKIWNEIL